MPVIDAAKTTSPQVTSLNILAQWVEAIHSGAPLAEPLRQLSQLVSGDAAILSRMTTNDALPKTIAVHDPSASQLFSQKRRTLVFDVFPDCIETTRVGAIMSLQEALQDGAVDRDCAEDFKTQNNHHNLQDLVVIPIYKSESQIDYLEIQLQTGLLAHNRNLLVMLAGALSKSWAGRPPGTAEKSIAKIRTKHNKTRIVTSAAPILDVSNPEGLSRCEFRVCILIKEGLLARTIATQLNVQDSTIRSHLRSIYMKTGTTCHVELLHRLTTERAPKPVLALPQGSNLDRGISALG